MKQVLKAFHSLYFRLLLSHFSWIVSILARPFRQREASILKIHALPLDSYVFGLGKKLLLNNFYSYLSSIFTDAISACILFWDGQFGHRKLVRSQLGPMLRYDVLTLHHDGIDCVQTISTSSAAYLHFESDGHHQLGKTMEKLNKLRTQDLKKNTFHSSPLLVDSTHTHRYPRRKCSPSH